MRKWLICSILLAACSESPLVTGEKADANRVYLTQIEKGMTMQQVYDLMGDPYAQEGMTVNDYYYDVWYYITDKTALGQERITRHNLTPLVFSEGILQGWGNRFFKAVKSGQIDLQPQDNTPVQTTPLPNTAPATVPNQAPTNPNTPKQPPNNTPQNPTITPPQNPPATPPQKQPPPNPPPYRSNPPKKNIPPSY